MFTKYRFEIKGEIPMKKNQLCIYKAGPRTLIGPKSSYRQWEKRAAMELMIQKIDQKIYEPLIKDVIATFLIYYSIGKRGRRPDLSNMLESCQDALVAGGVLKDDEQIVGLDDTAKIPVKNAESCKATIYLKILPAYQEKIGADE